MRMAPRASVTETIIGKNSGVSPTASATANRKLSSNGRWNNVFTSRTNRTSRYGQPDDQNAELVDALLQRRGRRRLTELAADLAELRPSPVAQSISLAEPLTTEVPIKAALVACATLTSTIPSGHGALFNRIGLAGQQTLVDEEIPGLNDPAVGRHQVSGGKHDDVAGNELIGANGDLPSIAQGLLFQRHRDLELIGGLFGPVLLHAVEQNTEQHHGRNDHQAGNIAGKRGDYGRSEQNQHQRIAEPAQNLRSSEKRRWLSSLLAP